MHELHFGGDSNPKCARFSYLQLLSQIVVIGSNLAGASLLIGQYWLRMEENVLNGLLESVFQKKTHNDHDVPVRFNSDLDIVKEDLNSKIQLSHEVEQFLSCPEGSSHIASLMGFMDSSQFHQVFNTATGHFTMGTSMPEVSAAVSSLTCSCGDVHFENSQQKSELAPSTGTHPNDSPNHSQVQRREVGHETTCCELEATVDRTSTHVLDLSRAVTQTDTYMEQVYADVHVHEHDEMDSVSVSVETEIISSDQQDAYALCAPLDEDHVLVDGHLVPTAVPRATFCTEAKDKAVGGIYEGSCSSRSQSKTGKQKARAPVWDHRAVSNCKKSKSSAYCKKEANKTYRLAHRNAHIVAERLRRKQMNEYFSVLKDIIPASYIPRLDQATILAAAVNLVRDLESLVKRLQEQKSKVEGSHSISPFSGSLVAESQNLDSPKSTLHNSKSEIPWIDVESGLYGQRHANLKSSAGEVEVQIMQSEVTVTVYASRKRRNQVVILLELFQDLQLLVSQLKISTDGSQVLYKLHAEIASRLNAKVIASRIHDSLLNLQLLNTG